MNTKQSFIGQVHQTYKGFPDLFNRGDGFPVAAQTDSSATVLSEPIAEEEDIPMLSQPSANNYVVVLASGSEDNGKRATLAFAAACTAQSMDLNTYLFMIGDGSHWAYQGHADPVQEKGFPALKDLMDSFVELEGQIFICSACDKVCAVPDGGTQAEPILRPEIQPRGLAAVMTHMIGGSTVTF